MNRYLSNVNIETLQKLCHKFPAVKEDIKWGNDLCFLIGGKMFCVTGLEPPFKVAFKVTEEEFDEMCARDGIIPAPYMARAKWILVEGPAQLKKQEWEYYIRQSYELVKAKLTKKARKELGLL